MLTPTDRDATRERAVVILRDDERVEAAVLTGSLGRGDGDRWSDIDLVAVAADGVDLATFANEWDALAYREWPVAHHYATGFGSTLVRGYLLRDALLLDMAFTPVGDFSAWAPVRVLFDRTGRTTDVAQRPATWTATPEPSTEAGFAAHDILHACVAANRGRQWQSLYYLQRVRTRTLALASERHGFDSDDLARVDDLPVDELDGLHGSLVASLDRAAVLAAVDSATQAFLAELRRHDEALADRLAEPLTNLIVASRAG